MAVLGSVPSLSSPWFDDKGIPTPTTARFLTGLVAGPGAISSVPVDGNAMYYVAPGSGSLHISGGTVTSIKLTRGRTTLSLDPATTLIPVAQNDAVEIDYTAGPDISFLPG